MKTTKDEPVVKRADCCYYCQNTGADFHFSDAVLCKKNNKYRYYWEVCQLFEKGESIKERGLF